MTRRDRFKRARKDAPSLVLSRENEKIVSHFWELRSFCKSYEVPITPTMIVDWHSLKGVLLNRHEIDIVFAMDRVFCKAIAEEIAYNEEQKRKREERKSKARR